MITAEITTVLFNTLFMVGIWWLLFVGFKQCRIDAFRQELFDIRDGLFDYAAKNDGLPFDSKAYEITRSGLNGMIRFAHQFTLVRSVAMVVADKVVAEGRHARDYENQMQDAMLQLTPSVNKRVRKAQEAMHLAVFKYVVASSVLLWMLFALTVVVGLSKKLVNLVILGRNNGSRHRWASLDAEAVHLGESIKAGCAHQPV